MAIKSYKPTSPGRRFRTVKPAGEVSDVKPLKRLTKGKKRISGRNGLGQISVRRRGGGHKRLYRIIDFKRDKKDIEAKVLTVEYDPNRSTYISLVVYKDGEKRYILTPHSLKKDDTVISGINAPVKIGNCLPLKNIPAGIEIHNIELKIGKGGQLVRSAGSSAQIVAKEGDYCQVKLPSGEIRMVHNECRATIGRLSNIDNMNIVIGKAGRSRWLGRRPKVRGVAMNPVDHPHGGGEGRSKGYKQPESPTGVPAKGFKTRKKRKPSDKFIIKRRK